MTTHRSGSMTFEPETQAEPKKRFWTKKKIVAGIIVGVVAVPGAAYAAAYLFGFGSLSVNAPTTNGLTVLTGADTPTKLTPALIPGGTAAVEVPVRNNNAYPVKVVELLVKNDPTYTPNVAGGNCGISVNGVTTVTFPANPDGSGNAGSAKTVAATPVTLQPGEQAYVTFPAAFTQDPTATAFCSVDAQYAVKGQVGS